MAGSGLDVDSVIERLLSVRGQPNNRTVQLAEGEIRALCATARCVTVPRSLRTCVQSHGFFFIASSSAQTRVRLGRAQRRGAARFEVPREARASSACVSRSPRVRIASIEATRASHIRKAPFSGQSVEPRGGHNENTPSHG
jgi:hypothetical protein